MAMPAEERDHLPADLQGRHIRVQVDAVKALEVQHNMLRGEAVPAEDKVVSLIEPHTAVLPRHKAGAAVEFGRKLWLAEVEGGIVSQARILDGAPPDAPEVLPSLAHHQQQFGRPPDLLTGDRGCSTATVRRQVTAAGVRRVALPHTGPPTLASRAREQQRWFQRGYRWRAGSRAASDISSGSTGWTAAQTMARRVWSVGWAGAC